MKQNGLALYCLPNHLLSHLHLHVPVVEPTFCPTPWECRILPRASSRQWAMTSAPHTNCLPTPGYTDGIFYQLKGMPRKSGERTAAFQAPGGHHLHALAWHSRNRKAALHHAAILHLPVWQTVYIQAHYLIDAIAGWISAVVIYRIDGSFKEHEMIRHGRYRKEIILIHQT